MIAWRWLYHFWEGAVVPREGATIDDNAANAGAVPTNELGGRVYHDVRPVLKRSTQVRRGKGVVDNEWQLMLVGNISNGLDVEHVGLGIADGLPVEQFRLRCDGTAELFWVSGIDKVHLDAKALKCQGKLVIRATVQGARRDHLIAGLQQGRQGHELGRLA